MPLQDTLFALLTSGPYERACAFLQSSTCELLEKFRDQIELASEKEFCLPLKISLESFLRWLDRTEIISKQDGLSAFLSHVVGTIPYYRTMFRQRGVAALTMADFPVITKAEILENYPDFISETYRTQPLKLFKPTTGTTGLPLIVWFDTESFYDLNYGTYGRVGDRLPGLVDVLSPGAVGAVQITDDPLTWPGSTILPSLKFTRLVRHRFGSGIEDSAAVAQVRAWQPPLICGMASSLWQYLKLERAAPSAEPTCRPRGIFVSGESLFDNERALLSAWFRCPIVSAYTSTEGGLIAMECTAGKGLHICEHVKVEILDERGSINDVGDGEIVITNLLNWAFPFIRYRSGDKGTVRSVWCDCGFRGMTITKFHGREPAAFRVLGRDIDIAPLDKALCPIPMMDFRLQQETRDAFVFKWVREELCINPDRVEDEIDAILKAHLGNVAITFERMARLTEPGMKARRYVAGDAS